LKKRTKKLLLLRRRQQTHNCVSLRGTHEEKFFASFFQKRSAFFSALPLASGAGRL
jgi:hypothetical protein